MGDAWLWVERLSWIVAIIGIPSLLFGLLAVVRRPRIAIGFLPMRKAGLLLRRHERPGDRIEVTAPHTVDAALSDLIQLTFVVTNIGRATARDLLLNFKFPDLQVGLLVVPPGSPIVAPDPETNHPFWAYRIEHIHPADRVFLYVSMRIPARLSAVEIDYEASMADTASVRGKCSVIPFPSLPALDE